MRNMIREYLKVVENNGGPLPISLVANGSAKSMGQDKAYIIKQGDKKLGMAFSKYKAPKPGIAGGTTFTATVKGKEFYGSRSRMLAWIEKQTAYDI